MAHKHLSLHDHFFRSAMAEPKVIQEFFQEYLPTEIKKIIDWDSIQLQKDSFIDDRLKLQIADMLYSANFGDRKGYLYVIIEQQTTVDKLMAFRLLKYVIAVMENHIKRTGEKRLPIVYPLVFFSGKYPHKQSTNIFDLFEDQKNLAEKFLLKPYQLIDLTQISDEELKQHLWLGVLARAMKHIYEKDILPCLKDMLEELRVIEKQGGMDYIYTILSYIVKAGEVQNQTEFVDTIKTGLSEIAGEKIMTIAELFRQEGIAEGETRGEVRGITEGKLMASKSIAVKLIEQGIDIDKIVASTDLPRHEILELKREWEHKLH